MWLSCSKPFCEYTKLAWNLTSLKARHLEIWTLLTCPALKLATFSTGTLLCRHITCLLFLGCTRFSLDCSCPMACIYCPFCLAAFLSFSACLTHLIHPLSPGVTFSRKRSLNCVPHKMAASCRKPLESHSPLFMVRVSALIKWYSSSMLTHLFLLQDWDPLES